MLENEQVSGCKLSLHHHSSLSSPLSMLCIGLLSSFAVCQTVNIQMLLFHHRVKLFSVNGMFCWLNLWSAQIDILQDILFPGRFPVRWDLHFTSSTWSLWSVVGWITVILNKQQGYQTELGVFPLLIERHELSDMGGVFLLRFLKQLFEGEGFKVLGLLDRHSHCLSSTILV